MTRMNGGLHGYGIGIAIVRVSLKTLSFIREIGVSVCLIPVPIGTVSTFQGLAGPPAP